MQADIVHSNCVNFFKYYELEQTSLKEMMSITKDQKINFFRKTSRLETKKKRLFERKDISKWEIGMPIAPNDNAVMLENKEVAFKYMLTKVR